MTKNWAIAIGINHYDHHPEFGLQYAVKDAGLMRDFLVNQAGFPADQVICCQGEATERRELTYPTCDNLVRLINRDLHPSRLVYIYYAAVLGISFPGVAVPLVAPGIFLAFGIPTLGFGWWRFWCEDSLSLLPFLIFSLSPRA